MDVLLRESVSIPNSVVVSGLTGLETDEEVSTFLQKYGSINRLGRALLLRRPAGCLCLSVSVF